VSSDLISTEKVAELKLKTDIFLTHDWGVDELGRINHDRVAATRYASEWIECQRQLSNGIQLRDSKEIFDENDSSGDGTSNERYQW
jgi:hypothetical protein